MTRGKEIKEIRLKNESREKREAARKDRSESSSSQRGVERDKLGGGGEFGSMGKRAVSRVYI